MISEETPPDLIVDVDDDDDLVKFNFLSETLFFYLIFSLKKKKNYSGHQATYR